MTESEKIVIRCAYADLKGALEAKESLDQLQHDWKAHSLTVMEMEEAFPFVKE